MREHEKKRRHTHQLAFAAKPMIIDVACSVGLVCEASESERETQELLLSLQPLRADIVLNKTARPRNNAAFYYY